MHELHPLRRILALALAGPLLAVGSAASALEPAAGGAPLLAAAESAPITVVGVIREPAPVDRNGWTARLEETRVLGGERELPTPLRIAWEELAPRRPPRFNEGDRVAVALVPLPSASLWRARFPRGDAWVVGDSGQAFLRRPEPVTLDRLEAYLAIPPAERDAADGVERLCRIVADAQEPLAEAALERLDRVPGLGLRLGDAGRSALAAALRDLERPEALRRSVLELIGGRRLASLRASVVAETRDASPLEAAAWQALAELDGGLPPDRVEILVTSEDPALRRVAVQQAEASPIVEKRLPKLFAQDPDAEVRALAVEVWLRTQGAAGLSQAERALFDPEPRVRGRAAQAIGALGAEAVPPMKELAARSSPDQALGPIAALRHAGTPGRAALQDLAATHPDEKIRTLARFALGEELRPH